MWPARYLPYDLAGSDPPNTWLTFASIIAVTLAVLIVARTSRINTHAGGTVILVGAGMIGLSLADASRWGLALICLLCAVVAAVFSWYAPPQFRWHLAFIACWSLVFAGGAISLTTGFRPLNGTLIAGLNWSAAAALGGAMTLAVRLMLPVVKVWRAHQHHESRQ